MRLLKSLAISLLTTLAVSQTTDPSTSTANATICARGAHIIVARASLEDPGYGILVSVKDQLLARIPGSNAVAVPYPATIYGDILYVDSEPQGVGNLTVLIKQYYDACPGRKMVLMGYSQGAQVVGDTLIGGADGFFPSPPNNTGLTQNYIDSVAAVVMMGDPANVAGQSFLRGNSTRSGTFPRNNTAKWASTGLAGKMVSYCDANDTFCDSGSSIPVHLAYVSKYGAQAVDFVVQKFQQANASASSASGSSGSSSTVSGSATATASSTSDAVRLVTQLPSHYLISLLQCAVFVSVLVM